jgi:hypothetical protein
MQSVLEGLFLWCMLGGWNLCFQIVTKVLTPSFPSSMDKASYFVLCNLQGYVRSNVVIDFEGLISLCKLNDITWTIIGSQS